MNKKSIIELLERNNCLLEELISINKQTPRYVSLNSLAFELNKSNQTIKYHLVANFEPEKDFKKKNGKIYIDNRIVSSIRRHYEKK